MTHLLSDADRAFQSEFESGRFPVGEFNHRAHLRLAYVYLVGQNAEAAYHSMRDALYGFLATNDIDRSKYHDTMTRAWILAVRHFMEKTSSSGSADEFIEQNPEMLDSNIMMTHYSAQLLFSDKARAEFVEPDLEPIPGYDE